MSRKALVKVLAKILVKVVVWALAVMTTVYDSVMTVDSLVFTGGGAVYL